MKLLRNLWPWLYPYRRKLLIGSVWIVVTNALLLTIPQLLRLGIAAIEDAQWQDVGFYAALMALLTLAGGGVRVLSRLNFLHTGRRVEVDLRQAMFSRLLYQSAPFFNQHRIGDLVSRFTNDLINVRMVAGFGVVSIVNATVVYAISLGMMLWMSPSLTFAALIPFPLMLLVAKYISRHLLHHSAQVQERLGELSSVVDEAVRGQASIRSCGFQQSHCDKFAHLNEHYLTSAVALARMRALILPVMGIVTPLGILLVLYFGGQQVVAGTLQLGDLVAFNAYLVQLTMPTILLGWILTLVQRATVGMERINLLLNLAEPLSLAEPSNATASSTSAPISSTRAPRVELRNLSFSYPDTSTTILNNLSLHIPAASTTAIVGAVASGKSTLLNMLTGRYPLNCEQVWIDGRDLSSSSADQHRQCLSAVLQEGQLFSGTLADNFRFAATDLTDSDLITIAKQIVMDREVEQFSQQFDTAVGEGGLTLSGGQRQRVGIARALARNRGLWLLDDPFSHLDSKTARQIWHNLRQALQGKTVVLVSSSVTMLHDADQVVVLDHGQIRELGSHQDLLDLDGEYARLYRQEQLQHHLEEL